jgi:hypothetical protein
MTGKTPKDVFKCFTHLVTPIGNNIINNPYGDKGEWPGRWVKVIAMTGHTLALSNPWNNGNIGWEKAGFKGHFYKNAGFPDGSINSIKDKDSPNLKLTQLQNNIWNGFCDDIINKQEKRNEWLQGSFSFC